MSRELSRGKIPSFACYQSCGLGIIPRNPFCDNESGLTLSWFQNIIGIKGWSSNNLNDRIVWYAKFCGMESSEQE